jgi:hypothetical protein
MSIKTPDRETFTIMRHLGGWVVEHKGQYFDPSPTQEEARAAANRRARVEQDAGRPCQVRVTGEAGFFVGG